MGTRTVRRILLALAAAAAVGCCSTAPPKEALIPAPIECPTVRVPPRPAVPCCVAGDTDADCATKQVGARVILEGHIEKLETLLAPYAAKPPVPAPGRSP